MKRNLKIVADFLPVPRSRGGEAIRSYDAYDELIDKDPSGGS